jgi:hypothetical protein
MSLQAGGRTFLTFLKRILIILARETIQKNILETAFHNILNWLFPN